MSRVTLWSFMCAPSRYDSRKESTPRPRSQRRSAKPVLGLLRRRFRRSWTSATQAQQTPMPPWAAQRATRPRDARRMRGPNELSFLSLGFRRRADGKRRRNNRQYKARQRATRKDIFVLDHFLRHANSPMLGKNLGEQIARRIERAMHGLHGDGTHRRVWNRIAETAFFKTLR